MEGKFIGLRKKRPFFDERLNKIRFTVLSLKVKTRLRELAPTAGGSQDAGSRNLVFIF